jgi:GT2 family glycosyltransferase
MAASVARGTRLLFTNADVVHMPGSFEAHLRVDGVGAGLVAGVSVDGVQLVTSESMRNPARMLEIRRGHFAVGNMDFARVLLPCKNWVGVWSSNLSVPWDAFHNVGGFDPGYDGRWGCEDYDLVGRMVEAGVGVEWVADSLAYHLGHPEADYAVEGIGCKLYEGEKQDRVRIC